MGYDAAGAKTGGKAVAGTTGTRKPKVGGRQRGTPNKTTEEVRSLAKKHGEAAIRFLVRTMKDKTMPAHVRVTASKELLERGYGKAPVAMVHTGVDNGPIEMVTMTPLEVTRRSAFLMTLASRELNEDRPAVGEQVN